MNVRRLLLVAMAVLWAVPAWAVQGDAGEDLDAQHHEERYGIFNILDYGAVNDAMGTTDDTAAIQAAYDACTAAATNNVITYRYGYVYIPPGDFEIADEDAGADDGIGLNFDSTPAACSIRGSEAGASALVWTDTDAATQTAMQVDMSVGSAAFMAFRDFELREDNSGNQPAVFIDLISDKPDANTVFSGIKIRGGATAQIRAADGFINMHMERMRMDHWDTVALQLNVPGNQNKSSFVLDRWSADCASGGTPLGFIDIEQTSSGTTLHGSYQVSNGRFECVGNFTNGRVFNFDTEFSGSFNLELDNVTVDTSEGNGECLLGMESSAPTASFGYNVQVKNTAVPDYNTADAPSGSHILCGDWGSEVTDPNTNEGMDSFWQIRGQGQVIQSRDSFPLTLIGSNTNRDVFAIHNRDDAESADINSRAPTFSIDEDGDILWSSNPGSADDDTGLTVTANKIAAQSDDEIEAGTLDATANMEIPSGTDPAATCTVGEIYLDTDGSTTATNCTGGAAGIPRICGCASTDSWSGL